MEERNVHKIDDRLDCAIRRIKGGRIESLVGTARDYSNSINPRNREFTLRFIDVAKARVHTNTRVLFYAHRMWILSRLLRTHLDDKCFEGLMKDDVDRLIGIIKTVKSRTGEPYSPHSVHGFLVTIKKALQYAHGYSWNSKKYPLEVEDIRTTINGDRKKLPEDLLTREEIENMALSARNSRDVALVHVLYESAARISEFLKMRVKDVTFDDYGAVVFLPQGKTGRRKVRLVTSATILTQWLRAHPNGDDPNAWIWCRAKTARDENSITRISYNATKMMLKKLAQRAGIKKNVYAHLFRHSRLTELAKVLTESQLCGFAGWVQGSDMARIYVHLSMRDLDDAILKANGIKKPGEAVAVQKKCARCEAVNQAVAKLCHRCMLPLDDKTAMEVEERKRATVSPELEELVVEILKKPENMEALKKMLSASAAPDQGPT